MEISESIDGNYQENKRNIQQAKKRILRIQAKEFIAKAKKDPQWVYETIKNWFVKEQARVDAGKKEDDTVRGYLRPIKGICEMNEVALSESTIRAVNEP